MDEGILKYYAKRCGYTLACFKESYRPKANCEVFSLSHLTSHISHLTLISHISYLTSHPYFLTLIKL